MRMAGGTLLPMPHRKFPVAAKQESAHEGAAFFRAPVWPHLKRFALALVLSLVTLAAGTALLGVSGWFLTATALTALGVRSTCLRHLRSARIFLYPHPRALF